MRGERPRVSAGTLMLSGAAMQAFLTEVLERGVPFRFAARGQSMFPFIMDADVITVSPLGARVPRVGDVVAFRGGRGQLVVHRIVATSDRGYQLRGDNCDEGDGFVASEAVLGVVTRVERCGKVRRFGIGPQGAVLARLSRAGVVHRAAACARVSRCVGGMAVRRAQRVPACRRLLRRLRPHICIVRAGPADEIDLARSFGLRADLGPRRGGMDITAFVARAGSEDGPLAGFVELARRDPDMKPYDGFWIHATTVATRYRGMGLAEALMGHAIAAAWAAGAVDVRLEVGADNAPALGLYRKLGFRPFSFPALDGQAYGAGGPHGLLRLEQNRA